MEMSEYLDPLTALESVVLRFASIQLGVLFVTLTGIIVMLV